MILFVKKLEYVGVILDYWEKPLASCEEAHEGPHVSSLRLNGGRRPGNSIRAREGRTSKKRERGLIRSSILCRDHKEKAAVEEKRRLQHHHLRKDKKPTRRRLKRMNEKGT